MSLWPARSCVIHASHTDDWRQIKALIMKHAPSSASEEPDCKRRRRPAALEQRAVHFAHRRVVGPMVGASDLAFRLLCRRHGADCCYTEMLFSERLVNDEEYRRRKLQTCAGDRPLVVQLQGNDPAIVGAASRLIASSCACDAVDLNLGCPLPQAEAQTFGAYLLDRQHWPTVAEMVSAMAASSALPVFCKIRLCETVEETIALCDVLVRAGCSLIAVHGRRRPPAHRHRGQRQKEAADLEAVRRVAAAVQVGPLIASDCC